MQLSKVNADNFSPIFPRSKNSVQGMHIKKCFYMWVKPQRSNGMWKFYALTSVLMSRTLLHIRVSPSSALTPLSLGSHLPPTHIHTHLLSPCSRNMCPHVCSTFTTASFLRTNAVSYISASPSWFWGLNTLFWNEGDYFLSFWKTKQNKREDPC